MFRISRVSQPLLPTGSRILRFKGADVELPAPSDNLRLEGRITPIFVDGRTRVYQSAIVWDDVSQQFKLRLTSNFFEEKTNQYKTLTFERAMKHGTVLSNEFAEGAIVDQKAGVIRFPTGVHIDGKTGEVRNRSGKSILKD